MKPINVQVALDKISLPPVKSRLAFVLLKLTAPELPLENRPQQNSRFRDRPQREHGRREKLEFTKQAAAFALSSE